MTAAPVRTRPARGSMFSSLHVRNYRLYAAGNVVSNTGTWMQRVAQDWLVLELSGGSGVALGLVTALQFGPILLFALYGGMLADRYDKRLLLLITQASLGLLALTLGILDGTGVVVLWHVYVLAGALGIASALDIPIRQAFVSELVGPDAAAVLTPVRVQDRVLVVRAADPAWASQVRWLEAPVVEGLGAVLGPGVVTAVSARVGRRADDG